jgi:transposase-like protein
VERMEPVAASPGEDDGLDRRLSCPWCDSDEVEKVSEYGPHLMVYQYICRSCHSPFEVIKR